MLILGIETSCDETSVSVVEDGRRILSNIVSSQIDIHRKYGGVVPELASRKHLETINSVVEQALSRARCSFEELDGIAVTNGPGLVPALMIGLATAKAIAYAFELPLIGVNHIEGHIFANFLQHPENEFSPEKLTPPFIALVVSGGHSDLIFVEDYGKYELLGRTRDDAVGESFDKVAKLLHLGYPGGPIIDEIARRGNPEAIKFPLAHMKDESLDFSFSGLKTAVVNFIKNQKLPIESQPIADIAASFQRAAIEALLEKTFYAVEEKGMEKIILGGGVASNSYLRTVFKDRAKESGIELYYPPRALCTDNAAMIGCVGYYKIEFNITRPFESLKAEANLEIESWN
jgi:N6-L-threonylcarbamoyladenine synthase